MSSSLPVTLTLLLDLLLHGLYFHLTWCIYLFLVISFPGINIVHPAESLFLWGLQGEAGSGWSPVGDGCRVARTYLPSPGPAPDLPYDLGHALCMTLQRGARDIAPSLDAHSVTVFSSEWRESTPRGGLEKKARYLPAVLSSLFYPITSQKPEESH